MKRFLWVLFLGSAIALFIIKSQFRIPASVYQVDSLEAAKSAARQSGQRLIFVVAHPGQN